MLTGDAKWGAFYGCDAFVLPSHQENFGIAVVEALACGKPVLITDKVNIWREVEIKQSGLISSDNESEIYNLLMKWMSLTDGAKVSMQSNASDVFKNHFSSEQAAHKLLETISISN
jgi:glycosyltransferase involved in cell wall biosynthesis